MPDLGWPDCVAILDIGLDFLWPILGVVMAVHMAQVNGPLSRREATTWIALSVLLAALGLVSGVGRYMADKQADAVTTERSETILRTVRDVSQRTIVRAGVLEQKPVGNPVALADMEKRLRGLAGELRRFSLLWRDRLSDAFNTTIGATGVMEFHAAVDNVIEQFEQSYNAEFAERVSAMRRELLGIGFAGKYVDELRKRPTNPEDGLTLSENLQAFADALP